MPWKKNDSAAFLAQMDMPLFAANEARNMTSENEALNMLDSPGAGPGLGGMDPAAGQRPEHGGQTPQEPDPRSLHR